MLNILYEDNHLIAVNKNNSDLVQRDKNTAESLEEKVKEYVRVHYHKPGRVFLGVMHRLDRPVSGVVVFARTEKALVRMNEMFREKQVEKIYWALVRNKPPKAEDRLEQYIWRNEKSNKSYIVEESHKDAQLAVLSYRTLMESKSFFLLEIHLETGRHHQIRCQLAHAGCPVRGDLKYGSPRSNKGGGISLHARSISFLHPVKKEPLQITAPVPDDEIWHLFQTEK
jgi:23S rRNA pseudouridine1911/1915/1917 synthase